ncbi:hypothetical protein DUI87_16377 [Hirundo rustica rustica]|uniref:Reverse transcriptase domain-containing protein n=1 Tax=Hirundo rustica rustica TaxID=333673 RepID=A0A3M0K1B2_HIRRU|nr:hypothetical protein DUI87_16377 [Hirundo rustica rustica]
MEYDHLAHPGQAGDQGCQHGFMESRSFFTNLIFFYNQVSHLVDEGKHLDVVYLLFSKALDSFFHRIFLEKLAAHDFNRYSLHWVKLAGCLDPESDGEWVTSSWQVVTSGVP